MQGQRDGVHGSDGEPRITGERFLPFDDEPDGGPADPDGAVADAVSTMVQPAGSPVPADGRAGGLPPADRSSMADHVARLLARAPRLTDRQKMDLRRMLGPPPRWGT